MNQHALVDAVPSNRTDTPAGVGSTAPNESDQKKRTADPRTRDGTHASSRGSFSAHPEVRALGRPDPYTGEPVASMDSPSPTACSPDESQVRCAQIVSRDRLRQEPNR